MNSWYEPSYKESQEMVEEFWAKPFDSRGYSVIPDAVQLGDADGLVEMLG